MAMEITHRPRPHFLGLLVSLSLAGCGLEQSHVQYQDGRGATQVAAMDEFRRDMLCAQLVDVTLAARRGPERRVLSELNLDEVTTAHRDRWEIKLARNGKATGLNDAEIRDLMTKQQKIPSGENTLRVHADDIISCVAEVSGSHSR